VLVEYVSTQAFLLRKRPYGDSDLIVVLLTHELGKRTAIAKGARRSRRRFSGGALEPFNRLALRMSERPGRSLALLEECRVIDSHHQVSADLASFAWASYISELTEAMSPEQDPCPELFGLLRSTMEDLARGAGGETSRAAPVAHRFILGLLDHSGWRPHLDKCCHCGVPLGQASRPMLDPGGAGLVCSGHEAKRLGLDPSDPAFKPSRRIVSGALIDYLRRAAAEVPEDAEPELLSAATLLLDRLVDLHLPRLPRSRRFLTQLAALEHAAE